MEVFLYITGLFIVLATIIVQTFIHFGIIAGFLVLGGTLMIIGYFMSE